MKLHQKCYESARDRLRELLRQETEIKDQISHWGPIVEQLARLTGETVDPEIAQTNQRVKEKCGRGAGGVRGWAGDGADGGDPVGFPAAADAAADADPGAGPSGADGV